MDISPEVSKLSIIEHLDNLKVNHLEMLDSSVNWPEMGYAMDDNTYEELMHKHFDESISIVSKILNHPHIDAVKLKEYLTKLKDDIKDIKSNLKIFINILNE